MTCRTEHQAHAALTLDHEPAQDVHDLLNYLLATVEQEQALLARVRKERRDHNPLDSISA